MADFDAAGFVTTLEGLGVKLAAVPLADGRFSVTRWKLPSAVEHAREIERLWSLQVGISQARIDLLARHILEGAPATSVLTSGKVDSSVKTTADKPAVAITATPSGLSVSRHRKIRRLQRLPSTPIAAFDRISDPEAQRRFDRLTAAGIEFIDENGGGPGVRFKKPPKT